MLFNSFVFLLAFLPVTYIVFWALPHRSVAVRVARGGRLCLFTAIGTRGFAC